MKSISQSPIILLNSRFVAIVRGDVLVSAKKKKMEFFVPHNEMARAKLMIANQINSLPTFFSCKTLRKSNLDFRSVHFRVEKLSKSELFKKETRFSLFRAVNWRKGLWINEIL